MPSLDSLLALQAPADPNREPGDDGRDIGKLGVKLLFVAFVFDGTTAVQAARRQRRRQLPVDGADRDRTMAMAPTASLQNSAIGGRSNTRRRMTPLIAVSDRSLPQSSPGGWRMDLSHSGIGALGQVTTRIPWLPGGLLARMDSA